MFKNARESDKDQVNKAAVDLNLRQKIINGGLGTLTREERLLFGDAIRTVALVMPSGMATHDALDTLWLTPEEKKEAKALKEARRQRIKAEKAKKAEEAKLKLEEEQKLKEAEAKPKPEEEQKLKEAEVKPKPEEEQKLKEAEVKPKPEEEQKLKEAEIKPKPEEEKAQRDAEISQIKEAMLKSEKIVSKMLKNEPENGTNTVYTAIKSCCEAENAGLKDIVLDMSYCRRNNESQILNTEEFRDLVYEAQEKLSCLPPKRINWQIVKTLTTINAFMSPPKKLRDIFAARLADAPAMEKELIAKRRAQSDEEMQRQEAEPKHKLEEEKNRQEAEAKRKLEEEKNK